MARLIEGKHAFEPRGIEVLSALYVHRKAEAASTIGAWLVPRDAPDPTAWAVERLESLRLAGLVSVLSDGKDRLWLLTSKGLGFVEKRIGKDSRLLPKGPVRTLREGPIAAAP